MTILFTVPQQGITDQVYNELAEVARRLMLFIGKSENYDARELNIDAALVDEVLAYKPAAVVVIVKEEKYITSVRYRARRLDRLEESGVRLLFVTPHPCVVPEVVTLVHSGCSGEQFRELLDKVVRGQRKQLSQATAQAR